MQEKGCKRRENMVQSGQREQKKEVFTYDTTGKKKRAFERNPVEKAGTPAILKHTTVLQRQKPSKRCCPSFRKAAVHMGWLHDHSRYGADKGGQGRQL